MGIKPTALYKAFTFGGESSADYGAFLTGEGVFNAPERAVEMIEVPGRNGSFAMDMGRFENVELTYNASIVDFTSADFADRISALRNWLCSKRGYVRLEDEYNPDEYRMAVYKSGLEVDHEGLLTGEFDITFDCKPQRYLKSGETAVSVTSGDTITNPTLFESSPLLAVEGYGHITINGEDVEIYTTSIGDVVLRPAQSETVQNIPSGWSETITFDNTIVLANGDTIELVHYLNDIKLDFGATITSASYTETGIDVNMAGSEGTVLTFSMFEFTKNTVTKGTPETWTASISGYVIAGTRKDYNLVFTFDYDGDDTLTQTVTYDNGNCTLYKHGYDDIVGHSTKVAHPAYIDCDIGECYMVDSDGTITLNNYTSFGSTLPTLAVGTNTITYDNTITDLKIYPRWWRV